MQASPASAVLLRALGRRLVGALPKVPYPVLVGPLRGARIILGSLAGAGQGASVYVNAIEPEQTAAMVARLRPGNVFFDVGANVGYYALLAARLVGPQGAVLALEPEPRNLSFLYRHKALNRAENLLVVPVACAAEQSLAFFRSGRNFAEGHLSDAAAPGDAIVATTTLDLLAEKTGLTPTAVKIDVEGAELDVLRGARRVLTTARPTLFLSLHSETLSRDCLALLAELGYAWQTLCPGAAYAPEILATHAGGGR
jgi:FkbM family methyltransferase